jgi:hypothetical protein
MIGKLRVGVSLGRSKSCSSVPAPENRARDGKSTDEFADAATESRQADGGGNDQA